MRAEKSSSCLVIHKRLNLLLFNEEDCNLKPKQNTQEKSFSELKEPKKKKLSAYSSEFADLEKYYEKKSIQMFCRDQLYDNLSHSTH